MSAGSARWRHRGMRMAARGGRDAGEAVQAAAGRYSGDGARWERAAARGRDGGAAWRAPWERVTVGRGPDRGKRGTGGAGGRRNAKLGSGAGGAWVQDAGGGSFLAQWDGCRRRRLLRGWLCREGEMKKRPHMRPLYVKAISFERLYGKLERELRLSSFRRVPQSSSWGERIRGKLQEPWCQQRCGRSYGIPKP